MADSGEREKPREPARVDPDALTRSIPPEALRAADVGAHELEPGAVFGRYVIVGVIGRGGMGVVYRARQDRPQREVALKLIRPGWMSASLLRRFEFEAELLGRLKHPGIAQVYEAGVDAATGTPYFAMELVEGVPLTDYAGRRGLNLRQRLELFAKVCDAVQHAHARGVIHRDLKPGNILVADVGDPPEPQPKVLDFGVARATDADIAATTVETAIGALIGTVPYMSPEQVSGDPAELDTRSDVYALGVVLYELLAGRLPYALERRMIHEAVRVIREDEPTRLSSIDRVFRGDVETIVGRSMEKEKDRRYQTAAELGTDIRRYLRDEPIAARPPSASYQLRKFARRNKALVGGVLATFVVLVLGIVGTSTFALRAEARRVEAVDAQTRAQRAEADAEQRADELEQVAAFQEGQLSAIDAALMGVRLRRDLIDRRRGVLESRRLEEPEIQAALEEFERSLAGINFTDASLTTLDENVFEGALKAIGEGFEDQPLVKARLLQAVADTLRELGLLDRAMAPQEEALAIRRRVLGDEHPDTLDSIKAMGALSHAQGRLDDAERCFRECLETNRRVLGVENPELVSSLGNLGTLLQSKGDIPGAEALYREALEASRRLFGDRHSETQISINNMGYIMAARGAFSEAEAYFREALEISRQLVGEEHPTTLIALNNLGSTLESLGKYDEARRFYVESLETSRRLLGESHPTTLLMTNNLGYLLLSLGKHQLAEPYLRATLEARRRVLGDEHPSTLTSVNNMGLLLQHQGRHSEAEVLYRESLDLCRSVLGNEHPSTLTCANNLAAALFFQGRHGEAAEHWHQALAGRRRVLGDDHPDTLASIHGMISLLRVQNRTEEAGLLLTEALDASRRVLGDDHPQTLVFLFNRAKHLLDTGVWRDAEFLALECERRHASRFGDGHTHHLRSIRLIVDLYDAWHAAEPDAGHDARAVQWRARLSEITGEGGD